MGALASLPSGECNPHDGQLTFLGRVLAQLPIDLHLGKLIMLGHVFGMLEDAIIMSMFAGKREVSFQYAIIKMYMYVYRFNS